MEDNINHLDFQRDDPLNGDVKSSRSNPSGNTTLQAFEQLFHKYYSYLCSTANAILHDSAVAEDIVQEFYITYWNKQTQILAPTAFRAYAKRAVTNDCIDYLRKQNVIEKKSNLLKVQEDHNPEAEAELQEQKQHKHQRILDLVAELPESRKQILILHAVEKLSYAQIAEKQGVSINTVRTQLSRAYRSLRSKASMILTAVLINFSC